MLYRLIALDLDGTAIIGGQMPRPAVRQAVAAAVQRGVRVVLATGRGYTSARRWAEVFGLQTPLVCYQGALIQEPAGSQQILFMESTPTAPLTQVIALAEERGLELTLYSADTLYYTTASHPADFYELWFGLPCQRVTRLTDALVMMQERGLAPLKGLFIGEPADIDRLSAELHTAFDHCLTVVRSHPLFVEVLSPNVSKGAALAFLARRYGISQAATIAVGDSGNDLSMVQWAGLGVAMGNATADVLAAADWVAPAVAEDGVAAVIERFIWPQAACWLNDGHV